ncbi:MAG TPA: M48 family metalloprotease [Gemmataceae bacterium]|nr:M48 family metalloprotease [Gemmataceae bacterium]
MKVTCPKCQSSYVIKDDLAGKRCQCRKCETIMQIPAMAAIELAVPKPAGPPASKEERLREMLDAFGDDIEPVRTTWLHRVGLLVVAVGMIFLPIVYVVLIAGVAFLLFYHVTENVSILWKHPGIWTVLFGYIAPLLAGVILLFFMIKPLFARSPKARRVRTLSVAEAPLLYALVKRVAHAVGAPEPRRIDIDCQVNASASFGSGLSGLFGHDLVLTIGMPLVAELTVQQLAGVIAHELGHFSQGAGMRLSYVIRSINFWFVRVVFERDAWDERLVMWSLETGRLAPVFWLARLFVWITRGILWVLMIIGHGLSCFLLRQMEYDADRHEIRLAGSDCFAVTSRRISVLSLAMEAACMDLIACCRKEKLPDDFVTLISHNAEKLPAKYVRRLDKELKQAKTGLLDTHPSYSDRLANAQQEGAEGIFHLEWPAAHLLNNYPKVARSATKEFYRGAFGKRSKYMTIVSTASLLAEQERPLASREDS